MKRWLYRLAAVGVVLLIGWVVAKSGRLGKSSAESTLQIKNSDPMETPSGWRYRQNQPHHWRYIMLQK